MVSDLFSDTQTLKAEVRRLRGRLDSILAGSTIIPQPGPGGTLPVPTQGALVVGNSTPVWVRLDLTAPASAVVRHVLAADQGDLAPSWKAALDNTAPTTIAAGATASPGTSLIFAHRDHTHGAPSLFPSTPHDLLDGLVDQDTVAAAVSRGALIVGNATPKWDKLAVGAAGSVPWSDGTDTTTTINPTIAGYTRIGSASAPANTTAGDFSTVRFFQGDDTATSATFQLAEALFIKNSFVPPAAAGKSVIWYQSTFAPDGTGGNVGRSAMNGRILVEPTADDTSTFRALTLTATHSAGAHDLTGTGQLNGYLTTVSQTVAASTVALMIAGLNSMVVSAGTATTVIGFRSVIQGVGTLITTLNHFDIVVTSYPATVTTTRGFSIPNLGAAAVGTAIGIDITAQSGATTNFDIRAAGDSVLGGYLRVGSVSAPANTTAGDLTATRLFVPNASVVNGSIINFELPSTTPAAVNYGMYFSRVYTSNGGNVAGTELLRIEAYSRPTAADTGTVTGLHVFSTHDFSTAFNPGSMFGIIAEAKQQVGSTTATNVVPFNAQATVSAGDVTTLEGNRVQFILTGGGTITTATLYNMLMSSFPTAITTLRGMNVPNLGNAAVTTAIGIDIAAQSGAGTLNLDIRSAGNTVHGGYVRVGSTSAPSATTAGDVTLVRLSFANTALGAGGEYISAQHNLTSTAAGADAFYGFNPLIQPATNSSTTFRGITITPQLVPSTGVTLATIQVLNFSVGYRTDAAVSEIDAVTGSALVLSSSSPATPGNPGTVRGWFGQTLTGSSGKTIASITAAIGVDLLAISANGASFSSITSLTDIRIQQQVSGATITTRKGLDIANIAANGTITTSIAIDIAAQTGATTNIGIRNAAPSVYTPSASQNLVAATAILANASIVKITATGGSVTLTATPTIADGPDGQVLVITNVGTTTVTFQDQGTLASSNLRLTANTVALAPRQSLILWFSTTIGDWVQMTPVAGVL